MLDALAGTWREVPLRPRAHPSEAAAPAAAAPSTAPAASVAPAARPPAPAQPDAAGEVTPRDLVPLLAEGAVTLLDVREPAERAIVTIPGDQLAIPLGELPARVGEVPPDRPVVVYCRSGARSAHAAAYLAGAGYAAANLAGGVLAWADDVEPGLPRY